MSRRAVTVVLIAGLLAFGATPAISAGDITSPADSRLVCLQRIYGEYIDTIEREEGPKTWVVMKNGTRLLFDDEKEKSFGEMLESPDLEDQFHFAYPRGDEAASPAENFDPGRIRVEPFFKAVYGDSKAAVRKNLIAASWPTRRGSRKLLFNRNAGAADSLSKIAAEISGLDAAGIRATRTVGGTFNYRRIAGTDRLSAHAFGIAVDVDVKHSAYWRWRKTFPKFVNNIPKSLIRLFERHGFIWGGKWYHFDTMHFEYRPEMFCEAPE